MKVQYQLNGLKAWYDEIQYYNFNAPAWDGRVGHFTQMVWKTSTALGCAFQHCPFGLANWAQGRFYLVCRYKPPGNYVNQMGANVMPLITSTPIPTPPPTPPPTPTPTPPPSTAATVIQADAVIAQSGSTSANLASGPNCRFSPDGGWSVCMRHTTGRWELMRTGSTTPTWSAINSWSSTYIRNNRPFNLKVDSLGRISIFNRLNTRLLSWTNSNLGVAPYRFEIRDDGKLRIVDSRGVATWQRPS